MKKIGEHFLKLGSPLRKSQKTGEKSGQTLSGFGKQSTGLRSRSKTGLKPRSKKRAKLDIQYKELREKFLSENPRCAVYPALRATQVHHTKGRYTYYLDVSTWLPVSDEGHKFIHDNPRIAREKGWLIYGADGK